MSRLKKTAINPVDLRTEVANIPWNLKSLSKDMDKLQIDISSFLQGDLNDTDYEDINEVYNEYLALVKEINHAAEQIESVLEPLAQMLRRSQNE